MNIVKVTYCREDLISRIPGLFAYLEYDEFGICHLHKSSDSDSGCYGKMVASIRVPNDVSLIIDGVELIKGDTVYNYRTLLNYYYKYRDLTSSTFIQFFSRGVGRFTIQDIEDDWDLVPSTEYFANAGRIYEEYCRLKKVCDNYLTMKPISGINCNLECLVEKYRRMGGDIMKDFYYHKFVESQGMSDYYFEVAVPEETYFDINLSIVSNENDLGIKSVYEVQWEPGVLYKIGEVVLYEDRSYVCRGVYNSHTLQYDEITQDDLDNLSWDDTYEEYTFVPQWFSLIGSDNTEVTLTGTTDSKLKSFRNGKSYMSVDGNREEPEFSEDWLWFYKIGTITNYESVTDGFGNIELVSGNRSQVGQEQKNLMAYGNIINDITINPDSREITFQYVIGGNLKATLTKIEAVDPDVPDPYYRYFYDNFVYNPEDTEHGIIFTETYTYPEDGQLDTFYTQNQSLFNYFIGKTGGNRDNELMVYNNDLGCSYKYAKCNFDLSGKIKTASVTVNNKEFGYTYVAGDYEANVKSNSDILALPLFQSEEYIGITYNPKIDNKIYVDRGNAASWERHIKLGEIKSLDDLENFANGGFFNIR